MQYRVNPRNGDRLSLLGYGCMRFTWKNGAIDQAKAEEEMAYALTLGINYFDTAWRYPGNEVAVGKFLAKGHRKEVFLATKMPQYKLKKESDAEMFFSEELQRLQTDYIDYYLMHMLSDFASWERIKALGIVEWIEEKKRSGAIRQIGFSYHGGTEGFLKILDDYDWDFCQIQYNYVDERGQAGVDGLKRAAEKKIPVIIMEPLRGGRLADKIPPSADAIFQAADPSRSAAQWGLRWLFDQPDVTVVLSGMNSLDMITENAKAASETAANSLTEEERATYRKVREELLRITKVPCTGCGYCVPCPHGVDIPTCFHSYNVKAADGWFVGLKEYFMCTTMRHKPSAASSCVGCGKCEKLCPQHLPIRDHLKEVKKHMEGPAYHAAKFVANLIMRF
ncbi:MAG: aldo/keto reductase [Firmicutes bacterium]|nr:aldo/keto reductase [Bacillota bacterium]